MFSRNSDENVHGKLLELETSRILLERNQQEGIQNNNGEYTIDWH